MTFDLANTPRWTSQYPTCLGHGWGICKCIWIQNLPGMQTRAGRFDVAVDGGDREAGTLGVGNGVRKAQADGGIPSSYLTLPGAG